MPPSVEIALAIVAAASGTASFLALASCLVAKPKEKTVIKTVYQNRVEIELGKLCLLRLKSHNQDLTCNFLADTADVESRGHKPGRIQLSGKLLVMNSGNCGINC